MKKLIKLNFDNTTSERKTEDSFSELYSYDKNNGLFEFEILNDTLTTEQVTALFKFTESNKVWKTTGTVEGNKANVTFDTSLITQNETVICFLYFDEEQRTSDTFRFKFKVKVSEIDKMNRYEIKERFINNTVIVDRLDVVTKEELQEALKNVGGIATEGLLTEDKAEELFVKKTDAVDNTNFELVKNRVLALELKTDKDTVYDDSDLKARISVLETKEDKDTIYDDTSVRERLTALESKPNIDVSNLATKEELEAVRGSQPSIDNLVTKEELESKNYLTEHQNLDEYAKKSEIPQEYNDTEVKERLTNLENKAPVDLSNLATKDELNEVRNSQPIVDTSNLVTRDELTAKNYLTEHQSLENLVTKQELEDKHYLTEHQPLTDYAKKSELYNDTDLKARVAVLEQKTDKDTVYDDTPLKERVTALESKAIEGGAYDDSDLQGRVRALEERPTITYDDREIKEKLQYLEPLFNYRPAPRIIEDNEIVRRLDSLEQKEDKDTKYDDTDLKDRVTNLENKPNVDLTNYITSEQLENKHYLTQHQSLDNLVTKEELNSKGYLTQHQNISHLVTNDELNSKGYLTEEVLNSKNYLTEHQPLTHLATNSDLEALRNVSVSKSELSKKVDATEYNTFKDIVVTKDELNGKGYLTEHQDISNLATKQEVEDTYAKKSELPTAYNDGEIKERLTSLESRPTSQSEMRGTGMPNGVVEAPIGTTYIDINKTNGALKWIKTTDGRNTGWKVVEGDTGWVLVWQKANEDNKNRMYFRRINDFVHVKFEPVISSSGVEPVSNLFLLAGGDELDDNLSVKGFQPVDDVVQTIHHTSTDIYNNTASAENSEGAQGTGAVIIQWVYKYKYSNRRYDRDGLKLQIVASGLGPKQNHVIPFSYLTEDDWPSELPAIKED